MMICIRGTKAEKMLTLASEMYTAEFCMVSKVIIWCIWKPLYSRLTQELSIFYGDQAQTWKIIIFKNALYLYKKDQGWKQMSLYDKSMSV